MALSPWPTTPAAKAAAIAQLKDAVAGAAVDTREGRDPDSRADQLGAVAAALVEREAPGAPQQVKDEAVIRMAGWLAQSDFGTIRVEEIGPRKVEYAMNHGMAFRHSGAKALLSPWKVRRAGVIG